MTRKEILFRENITLWNEYHTLIGAATTDLDEYAQTYKYQKALKESRAFDLERANVSLRQKIEKAKAEKELAMFENQLNNPKFVERAPAALVEDIRAKFAKSQDKLANIEQSIKALG